MSRAKEISEYISENIRDCDVIKNANEKFKFNESELKAANAIGASLFAIRAQMSVFDAYGEIGREGLKMIAELEVRK